VILDFSSQLHYFWALLPEIVVSVTALAVLLLDVFQRGSKGEPSAPWVGALAVVGVVLAAVANAWLLTLEVSGQNAMIAVDGFRVATNFIVLGATVLGLLFSFDWLDREGLRIGEYFFLVLMAAVGMMMLGGTRDLIVLFVAVELMSISVYVLTGFNRRDRRLSLIHI